jgi:hypothetical protein
VVERMNCWNHTGGSELPAKEGDSLIFSSTNASVSPRDILIVITAENHCNDLASRLQW